ncbi:MAG: FAD-dependent monooxygenase [Caulobacterales bacterium]
MRVLIAGGGIGGLSAALCLRQFGHDVVVFERAPKLESIGGGIQLSPNGMKVFQKLGVAESLAEGAFRPAALEMRMGQSGAQIFQAPLGDWAVKHWGAPYLHIHRADLIDVLAQALEARAPGALRLGAGVKRYMQTGAGVTVELESGEHVEGGALIGADGIHSVIRQQMQGAQRPRFTGNVAWRATAPMEALGDLAPPPTACVWVGPGAHCVTYRLRGGSMVNWVGVVERSDWTNESWTEQGAREEALKDFEGWHPTLTRIIESASAHYRWALFDRAPLEHWINGRVALLGDACHPMLPFMAQGAVMAIEDAWMLASCLARNDVAAAFRAYQEKRLQRTARAQTASRQNAPTFHQRETAAQLAAYGPMWLAGRLAPQLIRKRLDEFYAYDVTKA